jgi:hypothetical protein
MKQVLRVAMVAMLGACTLADERAQVDVRTQSTAGATAQGVARDAMELSEELLGRLEAHGRTPEELLAAAEAGDEQSIRDMLGYTDAEIEAMYARLVAIVTAAEGMPAADANYPEGWMCDYPALWPCLSQIGPTFLTRYGGASIPAILVVGGIQAAACVYYHCNYDRTDPGPPVKRP